LEFELTKNEAKNIENETPIEWAKWYEGVKAVGDEFTIKATRTTFKEEGQPVFFVVDEESNVGISVFAAHHPNAKFTDSKPHGVRLANAIGRAFELPLGAITAEALVQAMNDSKTTPTVKVEKTEKGILWTVSA
jgi:hypothetical protein